MEDTKPVSIAECQIADDMDIGYLVKILSDRFQAKAARRMKEENLTLAQIQTMIFIHSNDGSVSQKEIEKFLQVTHPTVVGIVSRMEKNGYVSTHQDEKDHRNKIVCTTQKADILRDENKAKQAHFEADLRRGMTDEEVSELKCLLMKVYHNLD